MKASVSLSACRVEVFQIRSNSCDYSVSANDESGRFLLFLSSDGQ